MTSTPDSNRPLPHSIVYILYDFQKWKYLNGLIYRVGTSQCIDSHKAEVGLVISDCDELYPSQKWTISSQQGESGNKDEV